jgi:hypothetical protein
MISRLALIVGIGLITVGYTKCAFVSNTGGTTDDGTNNAGVGTFSTTLVLRDSSGVATTNFVFGEPIRFDLEARNLSGQAVTLTFPTSQIYDFVVLDGSSSRIRWRWSANMSFTQAVTQLTFDPGSSRSYSVLWNGDLSDGTQLPVGNYRARGALVFAEFASDPLAADDQASQVVNFTVR